MKLRIAFMIIILLVRLMSVQAGDFKLISPDKNIAVEIKLKEKIYYSCTFIAHILKVGPNADRVGTDYLFESSQITSGSKLTLKMASGGGLIVFIK